MGVERPTAKPKFQLPTPNPLTPTQEEKDARRAKREKQMKNRDMLDRQCALKQASDLGPAMSEVSLNPKP